MQLLDLFEKYSSVDNHYGTDKITTHSYGVLYTTIMAQYTNRPINILEIGVFSGASALVWSMYLPYATIDGIDITMDNIRFGLDNPRIRFQVIDGTQNDAPSKLNHQTYDIIIDDASHTPESQIASFGIFAKYLRTGGVYIIEDINGTYTDNVREQISNIATENQIEVEWNDLRNLKGRFDDIVAVMYKR